MTASLCVAFTPQLSRVETRHTIGQECDSRVELASDDIPCRVDEGDLLLLADGRIGHEGTREFRSIST
jgi:hypothetical protein